MKDELVFGQLYRHNVTDYKLVIKPTSWVDGFSHTLFKCEIIYDTRRSVDGGNIEKTMTYSTNSDWVLFFEDDDIWIMLEKRLKQADNVI